MFFFDGSGDTREIHWIARRQLQMSIRDSHGTAPVRDLFADRSVADEWLERYEARLQKETRGHDEREYAMRRVNPKYILRNYLAQQVILEAQNGDYEPMKELLKVLEKPFDEQPEYEKYAALPPEWGKHLNISCSS